MHSEHGTITVYHSRLFLSLRMNLHDASLAIIRQISYLVPEPRYQGVSLKTTPSVADPPKDVVP
jgi:hypothetical protein